MELRTVAGNAHGAAAAWKRQFCHGGVWREDCGTAREKFAALVALGEGPTPEAVEAVIGNRSWTREKCDECGASVESIVRLGEEPDYESNTARVCLGCLTKAVELVAGA